MKDPRPAAGMTDRPIIFSAPMIRALLDGRKSMTRRVLKPQPMCSPGLVPSFSWGRFGGLYPDDWFGYGNEIDGALPYAPGDRLWVRETWRVGLAYEDLSPSELSGEEIVDYVADSTTARWSIGRNRSPIHMPRWASRLTLTVTDVRVQRLQEISEEDARAEGLATVTKDGKLWKWGIPDRDGLPGTDNLGWPWIQWCEDPRQAFMTLWDSIHGPGAWEANPWVCAVSFTTERRNIDA